MNPLQTASSALQQLREQQPLVVNISNYVVMNNSANALLAIGASPIMAHSRQEMAELMQIAGALVINIGTLDQPWIERMVYAVEQANRFHKPIVLDPVGCGASRLRTDTSRQLAELADRLIIRGNASEVMALAGLTGSGKGVDAQDSSEAALEAGHALQQRYQANVVISGVSDYILTPEQIVQLDNGHAMMPRVTGLGCSLSALTGAFAAIGETTGLAAAAIFGVVGELAGAMARGPGSLQVQLLDMLSRIDAELLSSHLQWRLLQPERS